MPRPIRVVLADDHALLRGLLRRALSGEPDLQVAGEAATGSEALALAATLQPDVLVLDVEMPGMDGVEVAARLAGGPCGVLACSAHDDPVLVARLLQVGAAGFAGKDHAIGRLAPSIRAVAEGRGRWFGGEPSRPYRLGADEQEALAHLAGGGRPATLSAALALPPEQVRQRLARLCAAFDAVSWYEALARAWGAGLAGCEAPAQSRRSNVPGQASSASAMSYGA